MAVLFQDDFELQSQLDRILVGLPDEEKDDLCLSIAKPVADKILYAEHQGRVFKYAASVPKIYVALALLAKMAAKELSLVDVVIVSAHNVRRLDLNGFSDERPAIEPGQKISIMDLFRLMITRSDDTAANVLIDVLGRPYINQIVREYGWRGSEVTRKFMPRDLEDVGYRTHEEAPLTVTCARHLAEFMCLVESGELINEAASSFLETLLDSQRDDTGLSQGLPKRVGFAHKTGWNGNSNDHKIVWATADCGIIKINGRRIIVACIVNRYGRHGKSLARYVGRGLRRYVL